MEAFVFLEVYLQPQVLLFSVSKLFFFLSTSTDLKTLKSKEEKIVRYSKSHPNSPAGMAQLAEHGLCTKKLGVHSQSGHRPGLRVRSPVGVPTKGN